jgi:hypothetical protein
MKSVSQNVVIFLINLAIFLSIILLIFSYNLHYFYLHGASVYDAGWCAWLSRFAADWPMPNPPLIGGFALPIHFWLIYFLAHGVAAILPDMPYAVWNSLFMALWPALLWLGLFLLLPEDAVRSPVRRAAFALLLTLNGLTLSMLGFPHVESFIPALFVVGIACWLGRRGKADQALAIVAFAVMLSVREDAGFHACLAFAALAAAAFWAKNGTLARRLVLLAAVGFCYSASVLALQKFAVPEGGQAMGDVYLGHPFLAHVDRQLLAHRLIHWAGRRFYIFVPLAILAGAALYWRDRTLALGVALCLPWLGLSLVAFSPIAGGLFGYYSAPLMFGFLWPLLLARLPGAAPGERRIRLLRLQGVMAAVSTLLFVLIGIAVLIGVKGSVHEWAPWLQVMPTSPDRIATTERFLSSLSASPQFDRLIFDNGAASLLVGRLRQGQYRFRLAYSDAEISRAVGFVRFIDEDEDADANEARVMAHFPICQPVNGTALEQCSR